MARHCIWKTGLKGLAAVSAVLAISTIPARATLISYDLTCVISGTLSCGQPSYGTVTVQDNASDPNKVDFTVDVIGTGTKVLEFIFNYDPTKFSSSTSFVLTGDVSSYLNSEDGVQADGYSAGKFDVQTPATGNIGNEPISFTIALASTDLNPADFNFSDTSGKLFDAVHIGNLPNGGGSIWVGSPGAGGGGSGGGGGDVPEPGTIALLAMGLLGTHFALRRRKAI